ncbi:NAD-dependent epimerase/dehydratase family protein [Nocardiopsis trehalosi]|uniref:NAD-dependent epimerase/dehydratase family protein n=1 Tax=Nocardiopsis trehalosi TaxID=109329 RepID=UPI00082B74FD|nr:NAD-dependent epimerase/dehydratase family protein [Nocardiopsis trehalosi]
MTSNEERPGSGRRFQRALVTGGSGFLGSHVCDALVAAGTAVVCLDNHCTGDPANVAHLMGHPLFSLVTADVSEGAEVAGRVDLVLHLASPASPSDYARLPLETLAAGGPGTAAALRVARRDGARFVLASTSEVYGDPLEHPQREDYWGNVNPVGPRAMYDEAKRYAEALTTTYGRVHGLSTGIVRIFNTYGPRLRADDGRAVPNFIRQAVADLPLTVYGSGDQTRSLCYVDDTVAGLLALAGSDHPGPVNIGSQEEVTVRDLALLIRDLTGSRSVLDFRPAPPDDPRQRRPDIGRARRLLGWSPRVPLREGLLRTIAATAERPSLSRAEP